MNKIIHSIFCFLLLIRCVDPEVKYNKTNKRNTSGVDYTTPMNLKYLMFIDHDETFELFFTLNIHSDTLTNDELKSIEPLVIWTADSLFKKKHIGGYILVMKETKYTNELRARPGISDALNPFPENNVYLVKYIFDQRHLSRKEYFK